MGCHMHVRPLVVAACCALHAAAAADANERHYHKGKLKPYELGPPTVLLTQKDETDLAAGKALMQTVVAEDGLTRRLLMVRDIKAPAEIVMDRILDLEEYDRMVDGVNFCATYANEEQPDGLRIIKSEYHIQALHLKLKYFLKHTYDPAQRCMIFRLDYDRRSDLDDTVGYWYVLPRTADESRVYYSCDTKLRGWVPPPVYVLLGKTALRQATTWVHKEAMQARATPDRAAPAAERSHQPPACSQEWRVVQRQRAAGGSMQKFGRRLGRAFGEAQQSTQQHGAALDGWLGNRKRDVRRFFNRAAKLQPPLSSNSPYQAYIGPPHAARKLRRARIDGLPRGVKMRARRW